MHQNRYRQHHRLSRLPDYDYTQPGWYFVTLCTRQREHLFGAVVHGAIELSDAGLAVHDIWSALPEHYPHVRLDTMVIMPDHLHAIIVLGDSGNSAPDADHRVVPKRHGLPEIVRALKSFSARKINTIRHTPGVPVWQRSYYDHIIRDDEALQRIRHYIEQNPARWDDSG